MKVLFFLAEQKFGITSLLAGQSIYLDKLEKVDFSFIVGGTEKEKGLLKKLTNNNIKFFILEGIEFHKKFFNLCQTLNKIVIKENPNIIHVQTNWQFVIAAYTKRRYKRQYKIFYTIHAFRHNDVRKAAFAKLIISNMIKFFGDMAVACSKFTHDNFSNISRKLQLINLGVDDIFFKNNIARRRPHGEIIKLAFVGEFRDGKNQMMLIKAISKLVSDNDYTKVHLTLAGTGDNLFNCKQFVKNEGLDKYISFTGFLKKSEVCKLFENTDIALIPTNSETFGLCIAEPYCAGCCVVSRDVGVAGELIKDSKNGFIFNDEYDLYDTLVKLVRNIDLITECSINAFNDRYRFHWREISHKYQKMYLDINNYDS